MKVSFSRFLIIVFLRVPDTYVIFSAKMKGFVPRFGISNNGTLMCL